MDISEKNNQQIQVMYENFKFLRLSKAWSIDKLSELSGINKKILTRIEEGQDFDVRHFIKLCRVYNVAAQDMFSPII